MSRKTALVPFALALLIGAVLPVPAFGQWDEVVSQIDDENPSGGYILSGTIVQDLDAEADLYGLFERLVVSNGAWDLPSSGEVATYVREYGSRDPWTFEWSYFGAACDISDNMPWMVTGDPQDEDFSHAMPAVDIWEDTGAGIVYLTTLVHPTDASFDTNFGASVATSGDLLIVGSPGSSEVFFFREASGGAGTTWVHEVTLGGGGSLGWDVAAFDDTPGGGGWEVVIAGSPYASTGGVGSGSVAVLRYDYAGTGFWIIDSEWWPTVTFSNAGDAVDIDNETAIYGAPGQEETEPNEGVVSVLQFDPGLGYFDLTTQVFSGQEDAFLGASVAVEEPRAFAGAAYIGNVGDHFWADPSWVEPSGGGVYLADSGGGFYEASSEGFFYSLRELVCATHGPIGPTTYFGFRSTLYETIPPKDGPGEIILATTQEQSLGGEIFIHDYRYDKATWLWDGYLGGGVIGTGDHKLFGEGSWVDGEPLRIGLVDSTPSSTAYLVVGTAAVNLPFRGGTMVPAFEPPFGTYIPLFTSPTGTLIIATDLPDPSTLPVGTEVYLQYWVVDGSAPVGFGGSNAIKATVP